MGLIKNKKGNLLDIPTIPIYFMAALIIFMVGGVILFNINDFAQGDAGSTPEQKSFMADYLLKYTNTVDFMLILLYFGLVVGTAISAYFIKTSPIFFVAGLIVWILTWFMLPNLANIMFNILDANAILGFSSSLPKTRLLISNFVLINIVSGAVILFALYAKKSEQQVDTGFGGGGGGGQDVFGE